MDMIKIFEDGFDIKKTSFFQDFPKFMKVFNHKTSKAMRLLHSRFHWDSVQRMIINHHF